jgi:indolepyruvate ferredoxin oxidoreductase
VAIASIPEDIRGFGHVKERNLKAARQKEAALVAAYHSPGDSPDAAPRAA